MSQNTIAGFLVEAGASRAGAPLQVLGETISVKISGADTGRHYAVAEEMTPPHGGPPVHLHTREDEWFYVLEGRFLFDVGGERIEAGPGSSLFAPRGIAHTFQNIGDAPARLLGLMQPAGMECFFEKMAAACEKGMPEMPELLALFREFGLEFLGPPLGAD